MSKFVIEISNIRRRGPVVVHPGKLVEDAAAPGGKRVEVSRVGVLVLDPSEHEDTSIKLTGEQFQAHSYSLEAKLEGKHGCERELAAHAVDVETGEKQAITYAEAAEIIAADLNNDEAALADQAKQAAEFDAAAKGDDDEEDAENE